VAQLFSLGHIAREFLCATLSERLANITFMKTFNLKIAGRAFCALLALDAVLFTLLYQVPSDWSRHLWWAVNWPGYSLGGTVGRYLFSHHVYSNESTLIIGIGLACTILWSALIGYVFRRRSVA
jgi:hypothetical protein